MGLMPGKEEKEKMVRSSRILIKVVSEGFLRAVLSVSKFFLYIFGRAISNLNIDINYIYYIEGDDNNE